MKRHTWPEELIGLIAIGVVIYAGYLILMALPASIFPPLAIAGLALAGLGWLWVQFHGPPAP